MHLKNCKYLSIAGAGTKGIVYTGILEAIEDMLATEGSISYDEWRDNLLGLSGTSAGAIIALFIILGTKKEVRRKYVHMTSNMNDLIPCPDVGLLISDFGWENGDAFKTIIQGILEDSGLSANSTLGDIKRLLRKDFACVVTDLQTSNPIVLSNETEPEIRVCDAIFMSACIPFIFRPMKYKNYLLVDGGLTCNLPRVFVEEETYFWYINHREFELKVENWSAFLQSIAFCSLNLQTKTLPLDKYSLKIDIPKSLEEKPTFDVAMNKDEVSSLFNTGYAFMVNLFLDDKLFSCLAQCLLTLCQIFLQESEIDQANCYVTPSD
jgi:hypothetical protein